MELATDMTQIYALVCPLTEQVRYIGKADNARQRLVGHLSAIKSKHDEGHKTNWLRKVVGAGRKPGLKVLLVVPKDMSWQSMERFFIASARHFEFRLTNARGGGEGTDWINPDSRERHRAAMKEIGSRPDVREKRSVSQRGRALSDETKSKIAISLLGKKRDRDSVERGAATRKGKPGRPMTDDIRAAISKALLGRKNGPHSAETRAKISASHVGITHSAESIAKISANRKGKGIGPCSQEKRDAISAARRKAIAERLARGEPKQYRQTT
jgi:hypothetical protein